MADGPEKYPAVDVCTPGLSKPLFTLEIIHIYRYKLSLASFLFKMESDAEAFSITDADIQFA